VHEGAGGRGNGGGEGVGGGGWRRQCRDMLLTVDGGSKMSARCLFFLDGGKREENPVSHTPLHRAAVPPLNTTPRGALCPPSSPSATKNKPARSAVRSSGCPCARALVSALPLFPPALYQPLSFSLFFSSLLALLLFLPFSLTLYVL